MALDHAQPGQPIDIAPPGAALRESATHAILKTHSLELMRVVLRAGEALPPHKVYGVLTLLCIEGSAEVTMESKACQLRSNQLVLLSAQGSTPCVHWKTLPCCSPSNCRPARPAVHRPRVETRTGIRIE